MKRTWFKVVMIALMALCMSVIVAGIATSNLPMIGFAAVCVVPVAIGSYKAFKA